GSRRLFYPVHHLRIIHHEHEGGILLGQRHRPLNVVDADRLLDPQHTFDPSPREQLSLGDGRARYADRSMRHLMPGDVDALVDLDLRSHIDSVALTPSPPLLYLAL